MGPRLLIAASLLVSLLAAGLGAQSAWDVAAPAPDGFDRSRARLTTREHLERLVALDTRNPPGHEARTAQYLEDVLTPLEGIETEVVDVGDGRANFVARLRAGSPEKRPVIVMGHMDTVGVVEEMWDTPPLVVTEVDGYLHGRGVMDDKGMLAAATTAMQMLAARRDELRRDVILVATAAEEGGPSVGIDLLVERHPELLGDAEFALNEGGRIRIRDGAIASFNVQTTEKVSYNVRVTATGPSGHGSVPLPGNALARLARACARLHEWRAPLGLNDTTRLYFQKLATTETDEGQRWAMEHVVSKDPAKRDRADAILSVDPAYNAVLRAGASLTMMNGGFRTNVIPSEGTATFNLRVLPDDDVEAIVAGMRSAVADEGVTVELTRQPRRPPPPSPVYTDLYQALESAARDMAPDALVLPFMSTGATDGATLRAAGIPTYGILPFPMERRDELRMHGDNERIPVASVGWAAEYIYRTLWRVAG